MFYIVKIFSPKESLPSDFIVQADTVEAAKRIVLESCGTGNRRAVHVEFLTDYLSYSKYPVARLGR